MSSATKFISLPQPEQELQSHSNCVKQKIIMEIFANNGSIGFDRYMELALYAPGIGYYSAGLHKFGVEGDFITAPEVSAAFSYCLANQCCQILTQLGSAVMLEIGAGSGRMACDLLSYLQQLGCLPEQYLILEVSADLRRRQQKFLQQELPEIFSIIHWLDHLPENKLDAVVVANEVVDALPFQCVFIDRGEIYERRVTVKNNCLDWVLNPPGNSFLDYYFQRYLVQLRQLAIGNYSTEVHGNYAPWINSVGSVLRQGVILLIDYGYSGQEYYSLERNNGTLLCHYRNRVHDDPFWYPGLQDITASVNFTVLADMAIENHLDVLGYTTQSGFLLACGLTKIYQELSQSPTMALFDLNQQIRTLTLPENMGERFRVLALGKNVDINLQGMNFKDLSYQL